MSLVFLFVRDFSKYAHFELRCFFDAYKAKTIFVWFGKQQFVDGVFRFLIQLADIDTIGL